MLTNRVSLTNRTANVRKQRDGRVHHRSDSLNDSIISIQVSEKALHLNTLSPHKHQQQFAYVQKAGLWTKTIMLNGRASVYITC